MLIVSVPGRIVRDPATRRVIDEAGVDIDPIHPHWSRLLADGDVIEAAQSKARAAKATDEKEA